MLHRDDLGNDEGGVSSLVEQLDPTGYTGCTSETSTFPVSSDVALVVCTKLAMLNSAVNSSNNSAEARLQKGGLSAR